MGPLAITLLLVAAATLFAVTMRRRLKRLAALSPEQRLDRPGERLRLLLRFGLGQRRLVDPGARLPGLMHVVVFGSFVVLSLRTVTLFGMGYHEGFHLPLLGEGALGDAYRLAKDLVLVGCSFASLWFIGWRALARPSRVTRNAEAYLVLVLILCLMVTDALFEGAPLALKHEIDRTQPVASLTGLLLGTLGLPPSALSMMGTAAYWLHVSLILGFGNLLPFSKHFHVITSLPNVFLGRLGPSACAPPVDLEKAEQVGIGRTPDLTWKQGLDVLTCTECGRCQTRCPAHLSGKPLSVKELNTRLKWHVFADPARSAELDAGPLIGPCVAEETLWSCTTCGACEDACPVLIENVSRVVGMRRHLALMEGKVPAEVERVFRGLETQANPWGLGSNTRDDWQKDLALPKAADGVPFELLWFVGCAAAFDERQQQVARALAQILDAAGVRFAVLGNEEVCCGDPARRLGHELLFQTHARQNLETFRRYGARRILTSCPHCLNTLEHEYPQLGGELEVIHHSELIARLLAERRLKLAARPPRDIAFHDSCYLGRHNGILEAPRQALEASGARVVEPLGTRRQSLCCGAGGGRMWMDERTGKRPAGLRVEELAQTGAGEVATACPFCLTMLSDESETRAPGKLRFRDVAEVVAESLAGQGVLRDEHIEPGVATGGAGEPR